MIYLSLLNVVPQILDVLCNCGTAVNSYFLEQYLSAKASLHVYLEKDLPFICGLIYNLLVLGGCFWKGTEGLLCDLHADVKWRISPVSGTSIFNYGFKNIPGEVRFLPS